MLSYYNPLTALSQFLQEDIYMYGGKIETNNGNVTDELWIFNIHSQTWSIRTPAVLVHGQQYAVEGHSAHIVELDSRDVVMIIIFGYSAIYGYTSIVQEYYISKLLSDIFKLMYTSPFHDGRYIFGNIYLTIVQL